MNKAIKALNAKLTQVNGDASDIETQLQNEWNKVFDDCSIITDMVTKVQDSGDFKHDRNGEICSYVHVDLSKFDDCVEYFSNYMRDTHFVDVDFENDCITYSQGQDCMVIQDDTRRDNGVWLESNLIISESEYKDEETGEIDEVKRNALIEAYMEKSGFFPGVFKVSNYGIVTLVNTKAVA